MAQHAHLSIPDAEFSAALADLPPVSSPDVEQGGISLSRAHFNSVLVPMVMENYSSLLPDSSKYRVQDQKIAVEGGYITVRCVVPTPQDGQSTEYPLLVWYHGGGWFCGSLDLDDYILRILCVSLQISIVNVEYRLAPEHPFPIGLNDSYRALKWAAEHTTLLSASLARGFLIGGESAGSNFVATLTHWARDDPFFADKRLTGQVLQFPCLIHPDAYPEQYKPLLLSMEQNKDAPFLGRQQMYNIYNVLQASPSNPDFSPLLFPSHEHLPPAYIQVCGLDPLRDEGLLYEKILRAQGISTKIDLYSGLPHGFQMFFPQIVASKKLDGDLKEGIRWLLDNNANNLSSS